MKFRALDILDSYKLDHRRQYPDGVTHVYSNWTPRKSWVPGVEKVVFFGLQAFLIDLKEAFNEFFNSDIEELCREYEENTTAIVGPNDIGSDHIRQLWWLGYLPLEFRALPEGTEVPVRVPMFTVENTHPDFFWLVNYLETWLSAELWLPCTSATTARHFRKMLEAHAIESTGSTAGVEFQGHDFSMRGHADIHAAAKSGAGHLLSFLGTDTIPARYWVKNYYGATEPIALSVAATEHSVMCAGGKEDEFGTYDRLLDLYPSGILAIVSDTWDLWGVLVNHLPKLKDKIMAREGKLVIRPDSGNPADILCGTHRPKPPEQCQKVMGFTVEEKGVVELLWDEFGGTVNEQGFKVLDPHIGAIYGDSITYDLADEICTRLKEKGFASTNVVFGLGSFFYQGGWRGENPGWVTRDTFGFAMKATNVFKDGADTPIFKDPITDGGLKKSAKGLITVVRENGELVAKDGVSREEVHHESNEMRIVYLNGTAFNQQTFDDIRFFEV